MIFVSGSWSPSFFSYGGKELLCEIGDSDIRIIQEFRTESEGSITRCDTFRDIQEGLHLIN